MASLTSVLGVLPLIPALLLCPGCMTALAVRDHLHFNQPTTEIAIGTASHLATDAGRRVIGGVEYQGWIIPTLLAPDGNARRLAVLHLPDDPLILARIVEETATITPGAPGAASTTVARVVVCRQGSTRFGTAPADEAEFAATDARPLIAIELPEHGRTCIVRWWHPTEGRRGQVEATLDIRKVARRTTAGRIFVLGQNYFLAGLVDSLVAGSILLVIL